MKYGWCTICCCGFGRLGDLRGFSSPAPGSGAASGWGNTVFSGLAASTGTLNRLGDGTPELLVPAFALGCPGPDTIAGTLCSLFVSCSPLVVREPLRVVTPAVCA